MTEESKPRKDETLPCGEATVVGQLGDSHGLSKGLRMHPTIVVLSGQMTDVRFIIDRPEFWLGRDRGCDIQLVDSLTSRRHARILYENANRPSEQPVCYLLDNHSTNGSFVNNKRVDKQLLRDRDRFSVGRTLFSFLVKDAMEIDADARLFRNATIDGLTGLENRRMFDRALEREFVRASRYRENFAMILIDIDHFKKINDQLGHQAGDGVLEHLGRLLLEHVREQDSAFRYGGEEFALLLPCTTGRGAATLAERIRERVEQESFPLPEAETSLTVSLGITDYATHGESPEKMLAAADRALYQAKEAGRNRSVVDVSPRRRKQ